MAIKTAYKNKTINEVLKFFILSQIFLGMATMEHLKFSLSLNGHQSHF
jgi:hypothetical protein